MRGAAWILALAAATAALQGCSRPAPARKAVAASASPPEDYAPAPALSGAVRRADGAVVLTGTALAGAPVRLAAPDGSAFATRADRNGAWTVSLPGASTPRLFALSEALGPRLVRARGYLALLPAPGPAAVVLRPGTAAEPVGPGAGEGVLALDYDVSGAAIASGRARPGQAVRLLIDGRDAGDDRADGAGLFQTPLSKPLQPGPHLLTAIAAGLRASAAVEVTPPAPIPTGPFAASRSQGAWRIDWITPGGGEQSTIVFDARGGAP